jgi:serine/threonine protein kinase
MVLFSDEANRASPEEQADLVLRKHLSFFTSDMEDFEGFITYHGGDENPFVKHLKELLCTFSEEDPRLPFERWQQLDPQFRHLVCKMTCMDPARRITARKALQHPWFAGD